MLALYRCGRTGEAMERYRRGCAELAERLGLDPSLRLWELHQAMLRGEPLSTQTGTVSRPPPGEPDAGDIAAQARSEYQRINGSTIGGDLDRIIDSLLRLTPALAARRQPRPLIGTHRLEYRLAGRCPAACRQGINTGSIRAVKGIDVWVNSENTDMEMSRFTEFSVSGIIRYWGAARDRAGQVTKDIVAAELAAAVGPDRPVAPGTAVVTGPDLLAASHGVRHVVHVASVQGRAGQGFQQIADIGSCVHNGLALIDGLRGREDPVRTVLFPILGVGVGGGPLAPTVRSMADAAIRYLISTPGTRLRGVYFLADTDLELAALEQTMLAMSQLHPEDPGAMPCADGGAA
jgi:O-acetyl-ADP-ribose deacetylase (regulator of RNase III)